MQNNRFTQHPVPPAAVPRITDNFLLPTARSGTIHIEALDSAVLIQNYNLHMKNANTFFLLHTLELQGVEHIGLPFGDTNDMPFAMKSNRELRRQHREQISGISDFSFFFDNAGS